MKPDDHIDPLPTELEQALKGLGRAQAPVELRAQVELELFGKEQAPAALKQRVFAELRKQAKPAPILTLRRAVPTAAAAALLIGVSLFGGSEAQLGLHPSQGEIDAYATLRAKVDQEGSVVRVSAEEMSLVAQDLAKAFGAMPETEGAE